MVTVGPQPQVNAIGRPQFSLLADQLRRFLDHPLEELAIGAGLRAGHPALGREAEDQIDVAGIVQFIPTQLAEGQHRQGCRRPVGLQWLTPQLQLPQPGNPYRFSYNAVGYC